MTAMAIYFGISARTFFDVNLKWVAEYRGTSVEMIEKSYASSLPVTVPGES